MNADKQALIDQITTLYAQLDAAHGNIIVAHMGNLEARRNRTLNDFQRASVSAQIASTQISDIQGQITTAMQALGEWVYMNEAVDAPVEETPVKVDEVPQDTIMDKLASDTVMGVDSVKGE